MFMLAGRGKDSRQHSALKMAAPQTKLVDRTVQQQQATNLTILQRKDEAIAEILTTATYVVIYLYNADSQQWTKKEIEGSLFVVKRSFGCRFRFIVLNRVNNEDLEEDITADMSFEEMDPFLMYRKNTGGQEDAETHAIWFHDAKERTAILTCMRRALKTQVMLQRKDSGSGDQAAAVASVPTLPAESAPKPSAASMLLQPKQTEQQSLTKTLQGLLLREDSGTENGGGSITKQDAEGAAPINRAGSALLQQLLLKPKAAVPPTEAENGVEKAPAPASGLLALLRSQQPQAAPAPTKAAAPGGVVLNKEQLKGVLLDLIQDDSFLETLHTAYLSKLRTDSPSENP